MAVFITAIHSVSLLVCCLHVKDVRIKGFFFFFFCAHQSQHITRKLALLAFKSIKSFLKVKILTFFPAPFQTLWREDTTVILQIELDAGIVDTIIWLLAFQKDIL